MLDGACHYCESNESIMALLLKGFHGSRMGSQHPKLPEVEIEANLKLTHNDTQVMFKFLFDFKIFCTVLPPPPPPYPIDFNIIIIGILCSVHALSTCFSRDLQRIPRFWHPPALPSKLAFDFSRFQLSLPYLRRVSENQYSRPMATATHRVGLVEVLVEDMDGSLGIFAHLQQHNVTCIAPCHGLGGIKP